MESQKIQLLLNNTGVGWKMHDNGKLLLNNAIILGNANLLEAMCKLGLNLKITEGFTSLSAAIYFSQLINPQCKVIRTLLQNGIDPNELDHDGYFPLEHLRFISPADHRLDIIISLIMFGADYTLLSDRMTDFFWWSKEREELQTISSTCSMVKSIFKDVNKDIYTPEFFSEIVKEFLIKKGEVKYENIGVERNALEALIADHIVQYIRKNQEIPPIPKLLEEKFATSLLKDLGENGITEPILDYMDILHYMDKVIKLWPFIKKDWETYNKQSLQYMVMLTSSVFGFEKDFKAEFDKECDSRKFTEEYNLRMEKDELFFALSLNPDFYQPPKDGLHNSGDKNVGGDVAVKVKDKVTENVAGNVEEKLKYNKKEISSKLDEILKFCAYFMKVTHDTQENLVKAEGWIMLLQTIMTPISKNNLECIKTDKQMEKLKSLNRGLLLSRLEKKSHEFPLSSKDPNNKTHVDKESARRTTSSRSPSNHR